MDEQKRLRINWQNLELAFDMTRDELSSLAAYLDTETGRTFIAGEDDEWAWSKIEDELNQVTSDDEITLERVQATNEFQSLPDWQQEGILQYARLQLSYDRFEQVPKIDSREAFRFMRRFVDTVEDSAMQRALEMALEEHRPFANFQHTISADRELERRWMLYEHQCRREWMIDWLRSLDIEPTNPDEKTYDPDPLPDVRQIMFAEIRRLVRSARDIAGVERIALLGTLATDEKWPKLLELLITVADETNLAPLARLGRQLEAHLSANRSGNAVIFVASPAEKCLGRLCGYRECGTMHHDCDALHCGQRKYLQDNRESLRLPKRLVTTPPAVLWPTPAALTDIPADVQRDLIEPLHAEYVQLHQ